MAEFCTCGSIIIGGNCTNKNCINRAAGKPATAKATSSRTSAKSQTKAPKTRKASKVVTYNLYDEKPEENIE